MTVGSLSYEIKEQFNVYPVAQAGDILTSQLMQ